MLPVLFCIGDQTKLLENIGTTVSPPSPHTPLRPPLLQITRHITESLFTEESNLVFPSPFSPVLYRQNLTKKPTSLCVPRVKLRSEIVPQCYTPGYVSPRVPSTIQLLVQESLKAMICRPHSFPSLTTAPQPFRDPPSPPSYSPPPPICPAAPTPTPTHSPPSPFRSPPNQSPPAHPHVSPP